MLTSPDTQNYTLKSTGIKNNTRGTFSLTCGVWWVFADYPASIKNNTRNINPSLRRIAIVTVLMPTQFLCNSVAIYICSTHLLIRNITTRKRVIQR